MPTSVSRSAACGDSKQMVDADAVVLLPGAGLIVPEGVEARRRRSSARTASVSPRLISDWKLSRVRGRNSASPTQVCGLRDVGGGWE